MIGCMTFQESNSSESVGIAHILTNCAAWLASVFTVTTTEVRVEELDMKAVEEWIDGSRMGERAAGLTRKEGLYLGTMATVAGAEEAGVSYTATQWR